MSPMRPKYPPYGTARGVSPYQKYDYSYSPGYDEGEFVIEIHHRDANSQASARMGNRYVQPRQSMYNDDYYYNTTSVQSYWHTANPTSIHIDDNYLQHTADSILKQMTYKLQTNQQSFDYEVPTIERKAPPKEFNRYINASDMLEEFIRFLGTENVKQGEVMGMPVELFIKWLIVRACEEDQEEPNVVLELPAPKQQPRCLACQRFMPRATVLPLHDDRCASRYFEKQRQLVAA